MIAVLRTPVVGFAAFSGTGKTTLLRQLIPLLRDSGLRLGLVKHSHHRFEVDRPGKDSFVLRSAGASQVVVGSAQRTAVIRLHPGLPPPGLQDFLRRLDGAGLDLLLVEGYKYYPIPKIELHRPSLGHPLLAAEDEDVVAVASDVAVDLPRGLPLLDLNRPAAVAGFIRQRFLGPG